MVLKLEQILGSKNGIAVLRLLVMKPYLAFGLTEISEKLGISKSNVLRVLVPLVNEKLVLEKQRGRKKVLHVNGEHRLVKEFWKMCMIEKQGHLSAEFRNALDLFYENVKNKVKIMVLFGSVARGLAREESDIDMLVVGDREISGPMLELPYRFEVHNYTLEELERKSDFVVLEALINGVWYKGDVFDFVRELKYFPKSYLIYRLNKSKEFMEKAKVLRGKSKRYYQELAKITLGEVESVYKNREVLTKRKIKEKASFKKIREIEEGLAKEGEKIWLI